MVEHNPDIANDGLLAVPTDECAFLLTDGEGKLNYALLNNDSPAKATIYITDKEGVNDLTFTAYNATGRALRLTGEDEPVKFDDQSGPSTFYFRFQTAGLLHNDDIAKIKVSEGWAGKCFLDSRQRAYYAACPKKDIVLNPKDQLSCKLSKITTNPNRTDVGVKPLQIVGQRVDGNAYPSRPNLAIQLGQLGPKTIRLSFSPGGANQVFISRTGIMEIENKLVYVLTNRNNEAWGDGKWPEAKTPTFHLSFELDDQSPPSDHALTTLRRAKDIHVQPPRDGKWKRENQEVPVPHWLLQPVRDKNAEILGPSQSVSFEIGKIVTYFKLPPQQPINPPPPPPVAHAHGRLYFYNIPDHKDGYYFFTVTKVDPPTVEYFKVQPTEPVDYGQQLTFHWRTYGGDKWKLAAGSETLEEGQEMGELTRQLDAKHTKYSLTCLGPTIKHSQEAEVTIKPPRIEEFKANPDTFEYGGGQTTLSWRTGSTKEQLLQGKPVAREGRKLEHVKHMTEFKLVGKGIGEDVEKSAIVTVKPPQIIQPITASMTEGVFFKEKITLSWEATGGKYRILENGAVRPEWRNLPHKSTLDVRAVSPTTGQQSPFPTATYTLEYDGDEHDVKCDVQIKMRRFNFPLLIAEHGRSQECRYLHWRHPGEIKPGTTRRDAIDESYYFYLVPVRTSTNRDCFHIGLLKGVDQHEVWYLKGDSGWRYVNVAPKRNLQPIRTWFTLQPGGKDRIQVHYLDGAHENPEYLTTQGDWPLFRNKKSEGIDWHQIFNPQFQANLPFSNTVYNKIAKIFDEDWG